MKRILVTGGAGFLGAHICERMLDSGHKVICLDNLYTGPRTEIKQTLAILPLQTKARVEANV